MDWRRLARTSLRKAVPLRVDDPLTVVPRPGAEASAFSATGRGSKKALHRFAAGSDIKKSSTLESAIRSGRIIIFSWFRGPQKREQPNDRNGGEYGDRSTFYAADDCINNSHAEKTSGECGKGSSDFVHL
jgi:hypothetical protein